MIFFYAPFIRKEKVGVVLVEEAIEKLTQARDTADPEERAELIDEVIEALEEGKIEPAE